MHFQFYLSGHLEIENSFALYLILYI